MLELKDELHTGKYPVIGCLGILKVLSKIARSEDSLEDAKKSYAEYKETAAYKKWVKDADAMDEDDAPPTDPEGWELYCKAKESPYEYMADFAKNVAESNPGNCDV